MNYEYSPLNPLAWGIFFGAWIAIALIVNNYRSKYDLAERNKHDE